MDNKEPLALKPWQVATAAVAIVSITSLAGWGWWKGAGPFREVSPTPEPPVVVDLMDGVKYMSADVRFEPFADFLIASDWNKVGQRSSEWTGKGLQSLPPYVGSYTFRKARTPTRDETERLEKIDRECTKVVTDTFFAEGFRALPYMTPKQPTMSTLSYARISTRIKTARQDDLVVFQVETSVQRAVNVNLKKTVLLDVNLATFSSQTYVVEEKKALEAMKEALQKDAKNILRYTRAWYLPTGADQVTLGTNPEENHVLPPPSESTERSMFE